MLIEHSNRYTNQRKYKSFEWNNRSCDHSFSWRSKVILFYISIIITTFFACNTTKETVNTSNNNSLIEFKLYSKKINLNQNTVHVKLMVKSLQDSITIENIKIEHPSYLISSSENFENSFYLRKDDRKSVNFKYELTKRESFKLKGIVSISSGKFLKTSNITFLFFYYDEGNYIVSNDLTHIIGKKKKNGDIIDKEDIIIFNKAEITK